VPVHGTGETGRRKGEGGARVQRGGSALVLGLGGKGGKEERREGEEERKEEMTGMGPGSTGGRCRHL